MGGRSADAVALAHDAVKWGTTEIPYQYGFKGGRRSLSITVHPDFRVIVTAPASASPEQIRAKVLKRARWIRKTQRDFQRYHPLQPPRAYVPGEAHRHLGQQYRLRIETGKDSAVSIGRGTLLITIPGRPSPSVIRPLVEKWMRERAEDVFRKCLVKCHRLFRSRKVPLPQLSVRPLARKWGSCTPGGRIILNVELIKAPMECIEYIIVHECCHLIEPNHNARFWQLLTAILPDWEERRRRLNLCADV